MSLIFDVLKLSGRSFSGDWGSGLSKTNRPQILRTAALLSGNIAAMILNRSTPDQSIPWQMHTVAQMTAAASPFSMILKTLRWILASTAALSVTIALLFMMHTLIEMGEPAIQKVLSIEYTDFIRVSREERLEMKSEKPKKIMPEERPEMLNPRQSVEQDADAISIGYSMARVAKDQINLAGLIGDFGSPDGEFLPLVRVAPIYPHRARANGIEGWVDLEFTITATGTVTDVKVIASSHKMFETTAVRAIQKFKYRPRIVNGQPVAVTGIEYRISFQLED
jgi:protein TonB